MGDTLNYGWKDLTNMKNTRQELLYSHTWSEQSVLQGLFCRVLWLTLVFFHVLYKVYWKFQGGDLKCSAILKWPTIQRAAFIKHILLSYFSKISLGIPVSTLLHYTGQKEGRQMFSQLCYRKHMFSRYSK